MFSQESVHQKADQSDSREFEKTKGGGDGNSENLGTTSVLGKKLPYREYHPDRFIERGGGSEILKIMAQPLC